jgi:uncharacterized protein YndB with AHSA1/START domain
MARTKRLIPAPPEHVFAVLEDPPAYEAFVVGTKAVRSFDPRYPERGSAFHHTLGWGPFFLRDQTRVLEVDPPSRLLLKAFMRPFAVNRVDFRLTPEGEGTLVEVEEYPIEGPMSKIWCAPLDGLMWLRNSLMLIRLERLARRRAGQASLVVDQAKSTQPEVTAAG